MNYIPELLTVAVIHLLAVMSPGPDFVLVSQNSLMHSRKTGIYTAIGLGLGILVHVTYSLIGIGLIISRSILLFSILKFICAGYLIYIGYKAVRAKKSVIAIDNKAKDNLGRLATIRMGFLTNVFNPKVTLFFFALFTQVINPHTPKLIELVYGLEMSTMTFVWFALVATILSHQIIKKRFVAIQHYLERSFGVILIALGIKVALSTAK